MKRSGLLLLGMFIARSVPAQWLTLTGALSLPDSGRIELNRPIDREYQAGNSVYARPGRDGRFRFAWKSSGPAWVQLIVHTDKRWFLLMPDKPVHVEWKEQGVEPNPAARLRLSGPGAAVNEVQQKYIFTDPLSLHAENAPAGNAPAAERVTPYAGWSADSLYRIFLPRVHNREKEQALQAILSDPRLSVSEKKILREELEYDREWLLYMLSDRMRNRERNPGWKEWADTLAAQMPLPDSAALAFSPSANACAEQYLRQRSIQVFYLFRAEGADWDKLSRKHLGISADSVKQRGKYGDAYVGILYGQKILPPYMYRKLLYNNIVSYYNEADLFNALKYYEDWVLADPPRDFFYTDCTERMDRLERKVSAAGHNPAIRFRTDTGVIASVGQLLAPYAGRVVYLDIWGSWCGPCKMEMGYTAPLKERFRGKEIIFLYLDNDDEDVSKRWKMYVHARGITGVHLRMNNGEIQKIWKELQPGEETQYYPSYFIFDRAGKMIVKNARRPSEEGALYEQLDAALAGRIP